MTPCLWFDNQAEEAMYFYTSIFKNSKVGDIARYGEAGPGEPGSVLTVTFELDGQPFMALNGGPQYQFTPAISFFVPCETQAEVDRLWEALSEGGEPGPCGWLTDKYGLSWQIVPTALMELMQSGDAEQSRRVTEAMLKMGKLDIAGLQRAFEAG
jgi:predicted 3-demethylubiquinone-9 3-methyltransferase (glyoxalase superfamily)